jgi:membrane associated rhomboid family serine protease
VLIAINVAAFLAELGTGGGAGFSGGGTLIHDYGVQGPAIAGGDWWRVVTGGFLHAGPIHLLFNMFALYVLGTLLEPGIGTPRFLAIYVASLFGGSLGALIFDPNTVTVGASGAIFGIFAATFLIARGRGMDRLSSEIGIWLVINLVLTVSIPGISIGGHLGGVAVGGLSALIVLAGERGMLGRRSIALELALICALGAACFAAALAIA